MDRSGRAENSHPLWSTTSTGSSRICVTFGNVSSAFRTGNVFDRKSSVRFLMSSLEIPEISIKRIDSFHAGEPTMDMARRERSAASDSWVFAPCSSRRKYCAPTRRHSCSGYPCTRRQRACKAEAEPSAESPQPTQQTHNTPLAAPRRLC